MKVNFKRFPVNLAASVVFVCLLLPNTAASEEEANLGSLYRTQFLDKSPRENGPKSNVKDDPVISTSVLELRDGTQVTLMTPTRWHTLAERLLRSLESTHKGYSDAFGEIPAFKTSLRLMDEETFYLSTGAPSWTNALYYKGQILIPLSDKGASDFDNIARSIRHEYTHAVVHSLSGGRCPGWLDEGLAQWSEGEENPALKPALANYLRLNKPVALSMLQNGFTRLEPRMVPAAYAQSLYATTGLIDNYGLESLADYLRALRNGASKRVAFKDVFRVREDEFEVALGTRLVQWAKHNHS